MKYLSQVFALILLFTSERAAIGQTISPSAPGTINTSALTAVNIVDGDPAISPIGQVAGVAAVRDSRGGVYVVSPYHHRVYRVSPQGQIYVVAGTRMGYSGDGGPATAAQLSYPEAVAADNYGNVFIADSSNHVVRKVDSAGIITTVMRDARYPKSLAVDSAGNLYVGQVQAYRVVKLAPTGSVTVAAGNGRPGFSGDGGPATAASFQFVGGIAVDSSGNLFVTDPSNYRVRKVSDGVIRTIAGNGSQGSTGDGGPAVEARLNLPMAVDVDQYGNVFIVENRSHRIRKVTATGFISTYAGKDIGSGLGTGGFSGDGGPATLASLGGPIGVAADSEGNLYIADSGNYRIRKVSPSGTISTFAGNGRAGGMAEFRPRNLVVDRSGNVYVTGDSASGGPNVVYRLTPHGAYTVFAGNGLYGFSGDGGPALQARFGSPEALATDAQGNLYISDYSNRRIRRVSPDGVIRTVAGNGGFDTTLEGVPATETSVFPGSIAVDAIGNLYISGRNRIFRVTTDGIIRTFAGNGRSGFEGDGDALSVAVSAPGGLVVDREGALVFGDGLDHRIRRITPDGQIRTIAGTQYAGFNGDGPASTAWLYSPTGMSLDSSGTLYFVDVGNSRVRKLTPDGMIVTVAGTGESGYDGDGGPALFSRFSYPAGVAWHPEGILFIADSWNGAIRSVTLTQLARVEIADSSAVSAETEGKDATLSTGYATIAPFLQASPTVGLAFLSNRQKGVLLSESSIAASQPLLSGRIYAEVAEPVNTGVVMVNHNNAPANVEFSFSNDVGDSQSARFPIPAGGQLSAFLNEAPFHSVSGFQGTFTFTSSVPIAVAALRGFTNERSEFLMTTLDIIDLSVSPTAGPKSIPHYVAGEGWSTRVVLVNPSNNNLSGTMEFLDDAGRTTQQIPYTVGRRSSRVTVVRESSLASGAIRLIPNGVTMVAPAAQAIVSYKRENVTVSETGVPAFPEGTSFRLYAERSGAFAQTAPNSIETGIAVSNTTNSAINVTFTLGPTVPFPGRSITTDRSIPARGHIAVLVSDLFGTSDDSIQKVLQVTASAPISVAGLRAHYNERLDLLLSATTPFPAKGASFNSLIFPLFVDSAGFSTRFVLFSKEGGDASWGILKTFSKAGESIQVLP